MSQSSDPFPLCSREILKLSQSMSGLLRIQQMPSHGGFLVGCLVSLRFSLCLLSSESSYMKFDSCLYIGRGSWWQIAFCNICAFMNTKTFTIFPVPLSQGQKSSTSQPQLVSSIYRPNVLAAHHVLCWTSPAIILAQAHLLEQHPGLALQLGRAQAMASHAWEVSTLNTYSGGLGC